MEPLYAGPLKDQLRSGGIEAHIIEIPAGEPNKTPETVFSLLSRLVNLGMDRGDLVIALGGGVVGDMAGFTASIYLRGIPLIQIPTSLLAQVDSSVGGKTGVNLPEGKNLTGTFYHPRAVYVDPDVLRTLPDEYFIDGFAEVIKHRLHPERYPVRAPWRDSLLSKRYERAINYQILSTAIVPSKREWWSRTNGKAGCAAS